MTLPILGRSGTPAPNQSMSFLLFALALMLIYLPLEKLLPFTGFEFFTVALVVGAVWLVTHVWPLRIAATLLGFVPIFLRFSSPVTDVTRIVVQAVSLGTLMVFFGLVFFVILHSVLHTHTVSKHTVSGVLSGYLAIGLAWTYAYALVEMLMPGAFLNVQSQRLLGYGLIDTGRLAEFAYFSCITLTTVGYGTIAPIGPVSRMLAMAQAIIGQVYLVVVVAWMMGLYVSHSWEKRQAQMRDPANYSGK